MALLWDATLIMLEKKKNRREGRRVSEDIFLKWESFLFFFYFSSIQVLPRDTASDWNASSSTGSGP